MNWRAAKDLVFGRLVLLAALAFFMALLGAPGAAHAHAEPPAVAEHVTEHAGDTQPAVDLHAGDLHADGSDTSGVGHCHGDAACSAGLHIVFAARAHAPEPIPLAAPDRRPVSFDDTSPGREPPVPIAVF
ncbi:MULTISPECIES: hypothetical protein [unclassified Marinovum]